jgi:hypothetical protein
MTRFGSNYQPADYKSGTVDQLKAFSRFMNEAGIYFDKI